MSASNNAVSQDNQTTTSNNYNVDRVRCVARTGTYDYIIKG